jgi:hypothetical protein
MLENFLHRCNARTHAGTPCKKPPLDGKTRCRNHGGASTGPRTQGGKKRSLAALARGRKVIMDRHYARWADG